MIAKGVPPLIARRNQFRRDLPELIGSHAGNWVAYSGEERIGVGPSEKEIVRRCVRQGLRDDEFVVRAIAPEVEEIIHPLLMNQGNSHSATTRDGSHATRRRARTRRRR